MYRFNSVPGEAAHAQGFRGAQKTARANRQRTRRQPPHHYQVRATRHHVVVQTAKPSHTLETHRNLGTNTFDKQHRCVCRCRPPSTGVPELDRIAAQIHTHITMDGRRTKTTQTMITSSQQPSDTHTAVSAKKLKVAHPTALAATVKPTRYILIDDYRICMHSCRND